MKKGFIKCVTAILFVCLIATGLFACGTDGAWSASKVTLKNWGAVVAESNGGFVAETENYVYFINGVGDSTANNKFGAPIKGALVAASKADMTKVEIVVPKIFGASDYTSGLFLDGDYVYYGSPRTDLTGDNQVANSELTFARTKLDGTETKEYFHVSSLDAQYRIVKGADNNVHIVYYDSSEESVVDYNTATGTSIVVVKKDIEAKKETLENYTFVDQAGLNGVTLVYTTKVYTEDYSQDQADANANYDRRKADHNVVYSYKVGDATYGEDGYYGVKYVSGEGLNKNTKSYKVLMVTGEYVFIDVTDGTGTVTTKTYVITTADLHAKNAWTEVKNVDVANEKSVIVSLNEVYFIKDARVVKTSLLDKANAENVAKIGSGVTELYFVDGDYAYYPTEATDDVKSKLARVKIKGFTPNQTPTEEEISEQLVSTNSISTTWYAPEVVDGKVFYIDTTTIGASYVNYVKTDAEVIDKDDAKKLSGDKFIGKMTDADVATVFGAKVDNVTSALSDGRLVLDVQNDAGEYVSMQEFDYAKEFYDDMTDAQKALVNSEKTTLYNKYVKALEVNAKLLELEGFEGKDDAGKEDMRATYLEAKALLEGLSNRTEIEKLITVNAGFSYQEANKFFTQD